MGLQFVCNLLAIGLQLACVGLAMGLHGGSQLVCKGLACCWLEMNACALARETIFKCDCNGM
eukprot:5639884-Alexandrium_andersonii.AAC.1